MKILFATFDSADQFLRRLELEGRSARSGGRVRVTTKARFEAREAVVLEIGFPGLPNRVLMRATFVGADGADADFEILPGEDHKRDFLVAVASGRAEAKAQARKHRRFPMRWPARFVVDGQEVPLRGDATTDELSAKGLFLKTSRSLPEGARVTVVLDPCDGSAEMEFSGRVIYTRKEEGEHGVGVQFDKLTSDDRKRLRRMIRDVKVSGRFVQLDE
jgi:hypothetical protein